MARAGVTHWMAQAGTLLLLSLAGFLVLGYHPYAEDGGIYAAAISAGIDPGLFPSGRVWATGQTDHTIFVFFLAHLCRWAGAPLPYVLLCTQWLSIASTLAVALRLSRLCLSDARQGMWPVAWMAAMAGVPVAGTALYLIDPYVTARSAATPLLLLTLLYRLKSRHARCVLAWLLAALVHPLMAAWGLLPLLCLPPFTWFGLSAFSRAGQRLRRKRAALLFGIAALLTMISANEFLNRRWADTPAVHAVALTRGYWFLAEWHWYEWLGTGVPYALLVGMLRSPVLCAAWSAEGRRLARAVVLAGAIGCTLATVFARHPGSSTWMARLQPMRTLHEGYAVFLLLFGGAGLQFVRTRLHRTANVLNLRRGIPWFTTTVLLLSIAGMAGLQRQLYPASGTLEFPWQTPVNRWEQAFVWAGGHTAKDAVFALDFGYTTEWGEDAQGFRAVALRSALPDGAKDAGIASVVPALAEAWEVQSAAVIHLNGISDQQRRKRLTPFGVSWLVLSADAETSLECPYRNASAKVCRLGPEQ